MKEKYDNPHSGPAIIISLGGGKPKSPEEAKTRRKVAKSKLKRKLMAMYDTWKPKTAEGKGYDSELKSLIDGLDD